MTKRRYVISHLQRLRRSQDFAHVYQCRIRASTPSLLVYAAPNHLGWTRFGLSVSRKHGNAVKRNRIKRLLREAFRLSQHELPQGLDLILIPKQNSAVQLKEYQAGLVSLTQALKQRCLNTANRNGS